MTIIRLEAFANGAHANQTKAGAFRRIPAGWAAVPAELEETAADALPWVSLTVSEDGKITGVTENTEAKAAWEAAEAARIAAEEAAAGGTEGGAANG